MNSHFADRSIASGAQEPAAPIPTDATAAGPTSARRRRFYAPSPVEDVFAMEKPENAMAGSIDHPPHHHHVSPVPLRSSGGDGSSGDDVRDALPVVNVTIPSSTSAAVESTSEEGRNHQRQRDDQRVAVDVIDDVERSGAAPTSASSNPPPVAPSLPQELCCPVCLDPFSFPVSLKCNHNVCRSHILDLAASAMPNHILPGGGREGHPFDVPCPKCRLKTTFEAGEASIHVNFEMQALIEMMKRILLSSSSSAVTSDLQQKSHPPPPRASGKPPTSRSGSAGSNKSSTPAKPKSVTFRNVDDDDPVDAASHRDATPPRPILRRTASSSSADPSSAAPHTSSPGSSNGAVTPSRGAPAVSMRQLERQIEAEREQAREERERESQRKLEAFKRQRREEIEARQRAEEEQVAREEATRSRQEELERAVFGEPLLHQRQLQQVEAEEEHASAAMQLWLEETIAPVHRRPVESPTLGAPPLSTEEQMAKLKAFEEGRAAIVLSQSAKARKAEERIMHLFPPMRVKTAEERAAEIAKERREREDAIEATYDDEVEKRLWSIERDVLRSHDEAMTRSQMAEIAEMRARAQIAKFRRQQQQQQSERGPAAFSPGRKPPPPETTSGPPSRPSSRNPTESSGGGAYGYVPKLNRLRPL